ncbi:MAG: LLM class F420-dependent oxidoreductase [Egibacteraceae bacterium]
MKLGLYMFPTDYAIRPDELARAAEEHGFESLFVPEHTHIPASRTTPWPGGAQLPREYPHTYDPFVALAFAAAVTERLVLGTGICLVVERDPITTAKEVASLDHLSGGRFLFGVGGGWNREEMANHGTDPRTRFDLMRERVLAMKAIWTQDEASYQGDFVTFDRIWSWPKPAQRPHPPVLVGGNGQKALERALDYGDGWMPIAEGDRGQLAAHIVELGERAADRGRAALPVTLFGVRAREDDVAYWQGAGVERVLFPLPPAPADEILPRLARYAKLISS